MIDWDSIRLKYIAGEGSQRQLAEAYHVAPSTIGRRAKR